MPPPFIHAFVTEVNPHWVRWALEHCGVVGTKVDIGSRLIVRARPGLKESDSIIRFAGTSVFEIMQIDNERGEVLLEACIDTDTWFRAKKRLQTAMWVRTDDPRFIFVREV